MTWLHWTVNLEASNNQSPSIALSIYFRSPSQSTHESRCLSSTPAVEKVDEVIMQLTIEKYYKMCFGRVGQDEHLMGTWPSWRELGKWIWISVRPGEGGEETVTRTSRCESHEQRGCKAWPQREAACSERVVGVSTVTDRGGRGCSGQKVWNLRELPTSSGRLFKAGEWHDHLTPCPCQFLKRGTVMEKILGVA